MKKITGPMRQMLFDKFDGGYKHRPPRSTNIEKLPKFQGGLKSVEKGLASRGLLRPNGDLSEEGSRVARSFMVLSGSRYEIGGLALVNRNGERALLDRNIESHFDLINFLDEIVRFFQWTQEPLTGWHTLGPKLKPKPRVKFMIVNIDESVRIVDYDRDGEVYTRGSFGGCKIEELYGRRFRLLTDILIGV